MSERCHGTSANTIRGGVRYDRDFNGRWFGYGFDLEHNGLQDLTLRLVPGGASAGNSR